MTQENSSKPAKLKRKRAAYIRAPNVHHPIEHRETKDYPRASAFNAYDNLHFTSKRVVERHFSDVLDHCADLTRRSHFDEE
jgi:hypothetical protein